MMVTVACVTVYVNVIIRAFLSGFYTGKNLKNNGAAGGSATFLKHFIIAITEKSIHFRVYVYVILPSVFGCVVCQIYVQLYSVLIHRCIVHL